jgi:hypothetical protein
MKAMKLTLTVLIVSFICVSMFFIGEARALPTWSKKLAAAKRFVLVLKKEAVLDKETELVWEKSPDTSTYNWINAISHCANLNVGDRKGWHLPTVEQLASLVDTSVSGDPKLPTGHPFIGVQSSHYWSATTGAGNTPSAWVVNFGFGGLVGSGDKTAGSHAWCVRGGQSHDGQ